jgi:hypothetical protein
VILTTLVAKPSNYCKKEEEEEEEEEEAMMNA